jgi:hypothetical protein
MTKLLATLVASMFIAGAAYANDAKKDATPAKADAKTAAPAKDAKAAPAKDAKAAPAKDAKAAPAKDAKDSKAAAPAAPASK